MRTDDLDFHLPPELIAQQPANNRTDARLMVYHHAPGRIEHRHVRDLPELLSPSDFLVVNNTAVTPARFTVLKPTGGRLEGLWISTDAEPPHRNGRVLLKGLGKFEPGVKLTFERDPSAYLIVRDKHPADGYAVEASENLTALVERLGRMPLPPYIKRSKGRDERDQFDRQRYRTVFDRTGHSVAAPTAGLHFDEALLAQLSGRGVGLGSVNLEVGLGTFKPVEAEDLSRHEMHSERWIITPEDAESLNAARSAGKRIIAVGTTVCRTLESQPPGEFQAGSGDTNLLIQPPYDFKHVGALMTNFHLPRSTLLALVSAFIGLEQQRELYRVAIEEKYRFFSYGDAMLLL